MNGYTVITLQLKDDDYEAWTDYWCEKGLVKKEGKSGKVKGIVDINSKEFTALIKSKIAQQH